jgi:hypothetical protein
MSTLLLRPAGAASYAGLEVKAMQGGVRVGGAAASSSSWEVARRAAWEALGDSSACASDERFAGKAAWELRFQAQLERVALNMEEAEGYYRCSIVADPLFAQAWIEIADIRVHTGYNKPSVYWAQALVRSDACKSAAGADFLRLSLTASLCVRGSHTTPTSIAGVPSRPRPASSQRIERC